MHATINHNTENRRITLTVREDGLGGYFWWPDEYSDPTQGAGATFARMEDAVAVARSLWGAEAWDLRFDTAEADDVQSTP